MRSHTTWTSVEESTPSDGEIVTVIVLGVSKCGMP